MVSGSRDIPDPASRVARELRRLEALAARRRFRIAVRRALRGSLGAGATLAALIKLKVAGSLALKLGLALVVGLGFAWPALALAVLVVGFLVAALFEGDAGGCDCPCDCRRRESRRARLDGLIARRKDWLASRAGPAPSIRA